MSARVPEVSAAIASDHVAHSRHEERLVFPEVRNTKRLSMQSIYFCSTYFGHIMYLLFDLLLM
jgi:hypothetical protein